MELLLSLGEEQTRLGEGEDHSLRGALFEAPLTFPASLVFSHLSHPSTLHIVLWLLRTLP